MLSGLPTIASRSVAVLEQLEAMTRNGIRLSPESIAAIAQAERRNGRWRTVAVWVIALTFIGIWWSVR